jgi:hypothetical protein
MTGFRSASRQFIWTSGEKEMTKFLRLAALAATAAMALTATQAAAVPATTNATATARILRPLTLTSTQNLDLGTIILSGAAPFSATVGVSRAGVPNCDGGSSTNITCSGTMQNAIYNVRGTNNQVVTVNAGPVTMNGSNGGTLTLNPDVAPTVTLTSSGSPGVDFGVGGTVVVTDTTVDGVYTGTFAVTADYQ